jgi:hypothetical protein
MRYALLADWRQSDSFGTGYGHVTVRAVEVADDGSPRNLSTDDDYRERERALNGIMLTAQADRGDHSSAGDPPDYSYAWRVGIAPHAGETVSLRIAAETVRTLTAASRKVDRLDTRYGRPRTFGAFVARWADALGLPVMTGRTGSDGMYNGAGSQWTEWTSGDAVSVIDGWLTKFRAGDR